MFFILLALTVTLVYTLLNMLIAVKQLTIKGKLYLLSLVDILTRLHIHGILCCGKGAVAKQRAVEENEQCVHEVE